MGPGMQAYHLLTERTLERPEQAGAVVVNPGVGSAQPWRRNRRDGLVLDLLDKKLEGLDWTMAERWGRRTTQPVSPANNHVPMSRQLWISLFIS